MRIKVSLQGNVVEVSRLLRMNSDCPIVKLSADEYVVKSEGTGEVHEVVHGESRASSEKSIRRTFQKLRALINTNCTEPRNLRWITLTYAENMTDSARLYEDFRRFWMRFKYREWGKGAEYIVCAEPQGRGAWHMHLLAIYEKKAPYIPNAELRECWRHGFVKVEAVKNVDNIGAYLSAYVTNIEVTTDPDNFDNADLVHKESDGTEKRFIKGARMRLYPNGMRIFRHSRGLKMPEERWVTEEEVREITSGMAKTYEAEYEFLGEDGFYQKVEKVFYNRARKPGSGEEGE